MASDNKNYFYFILALAVCVLLLLPYLGVLDFISPASDGGTPPQRALKKDSYGATDSEPAAIRDQPKPRQEEQKKRLAEIEQLLD